MIFLSRIFASLEARLSQPKLSVWRTVYVNLRLLPFSQAKYLPIFIYGKVNLFILSGSVLINAPIRRGMIKIGKNTESFSCFDGSGFIQVNSGTHIEFCGPAQFGINSKVRLVGGNLKIGKNVFLGSGVRVICNGSNISIGDNCRIAFDTTIMNSGFHYIYNTSKHGYGRVARPIVIGANNWIGNKSTIFAGAVTKTGTIVGSGSLLNRDYTKLEGEGMLLIRRSTSQSYWYGIQTCIFSEYSF